MTVRPGDRVAYCLDTGDAAWVNNQRKNFQFAQATSSHGKHPHELSPYGGAGLQAHVGLAVDAGQWLPADVVLVAGSGTLCLRVLLPGPDCRWVTNVPEGDGPGTWRPL